MKTEMVDRSQQICSVVDLRLIMRWARYLMTGDIPYFHVTHSYFFHFSTSVSRFSNRHLFYLAYKRGREGGHWGLQVTAKPKKKNHPKPQKNSIKPRNTLKPDNFSHPSDQTLIDPTQW